MLGNVQQNPKYCAYYVKRFAYFVSEWQTMRRNGQITIKDIYKRSSVHDQKLITECRESNDVIGLLC